MVDQQLDQLEQQRVSGLGAGWQPLAGESGGEQLQHAPQPTSVASDCIRVAASSLEPPVACTTLTPDRAPCSAAQPPLLQQRLSPAQTKTYESLYSSSSSFVWPGADSCLHVSSASTAVSPHHFPLDVQHTRTMNTRIPASSGWPPARCGQLRRATSSSHWLGTCAQALGPRMHASSSRVPALHVGNVRSDSLMSLSSAATVTAAQQHAQPTPPPRPAAPSDMNRCAATAVLRLLMNLQLVLLFTLMTAMCRCWQAAVSREHSASRLVEQSRMQCEHRFS